METRKELDLEEMGKVTGGVETRRYTDYTPIQEADPLKNPDARMRQADPSEIPSTTLEELMSASAAAAAADAGRNK